VQLALALAQCGDGNAGCDMLAQAMREGQSIGMCRVFLDEGPRLAALAARAEPQDVTPPLGWVPYANSSVIPLAHRLATSSAPSLTKPRSGEWPSSTVAGDSCEALKEREIEILVMLDQGRSNKEIARVMAVGVNTVKWYLKSVYAKLGVASRTQAVYQARRNGLLQSDRYPPLQR
jgi:ATP/maltotriose-dependent transcriptional regulator MalT